MDANLKNKFIKKIKSLSDIPNIKVHIIMHTVRKNVEGFTMCEIKDANKAHNAM